MKAFIAVMLITAVSGQITTGMDKNIVDLLRYRSLYGQGQIQGGQYLGGQYGGVFGRGVGVPTTSALYNYIQQLQQTMNGVTGDKTTVGTGFVQPSTQQVNTFSDVFVYTLRQLTTLPLFQEYYSIPLFREYLEVPAFQRYIVSPAFQQYWTQAVFKNFFVDPVLFYKYIYPVVQQFQGQYQYNPINYNGQYYNGQYNGQYNTQVGGVTIPEIFRGINTVYGQGQVFGRQGVPTTTTYGNLYNNIFNRYNGVEYNTVNDLLNTRTVYPDVYGYGVYGKVNKNMYNKNIYDVLTGKTELYPFGVVGQQQVNTPFITTTTDKTAEMYLEKIVKDLLKGKIDINDLKDTTQTTLLNEQINKIVDPITGDYKIVEEKIVKPFENVMTEGEQTKQDTLVKKILLNKAIFNKL